MDIHRRIEFQGGKKRFSISERYNSLTVWREHSTIAAKGENENLRPEGILNVGKYWGEPHKRGDLCREKINCIILHGLWPNITNLI